MRPIGIAEPQQVPVVRGGSRRALTAGLLLCTAAGLPVLANPAPVAAQAAAGGAPVVWKVDSLRSIGGHPVTVIGAPRVVDTAAGRAVEFNGTSDGLFLDVNPLQGLERFTVEVVFQPAPDGGDEQRFLHVEESGTGNRALIELRMLPGASWCLDTFLRHGEASRTLIERAAAHPSGRWHSAALSFDGQTMAHYVDGVREASGAVRFRPLASGRTSIGVRQNRVSWFKGRIRLIRITPRALAPGELLKDKGTLPALGMQATTPRAGPPTVPLWPEGVPGARADGGQEQFADGRVYNVQVPTLTYYAPADGPRTRTAVIVCPGGGYARLAMANEAAGVAERLRSLGISVFVLKYRLADYGHPAPLQDVLRAIRLVRARAAEFAVEPDRVGVFGASAGGHLAAVAATLYEAAEGRTGAPLDAVSARPDFVALLYPVITMRHPFVHADSRRNLLGEQPPDALLDRLSVELQVTRDTPPAFLVHSAADRSVPLENSLLFFQALRRAGVPAELHLYERGEHGFGTRDDLGPTSGWVDRWMDWMRSHGWL